MTNLERFRRAQARKRRSAKGRVTVRRSTSVPEAVPDEPERRMTKHEFYSWLERTLAVAYGPPAEKPKPLSPVARAYTPAPAGSQPPQRSLRTFAASDPRNFYTAAPNYGVRPNRAEHSRRDLPYTPAPQFTGAKR